MGKIAPKGKKEAAFLRIFLDIENLLRSDPHRVPPSPIKEIFKPKAFMGENVYLTI
jgi:hypothetical protein